MEISRTDDTVTYAQDVNTNIVGASAAFDTRGFRAAVLYAIDESGNAWTVAGLRAFWTIAGSPKVPFVPDVRLTPSVPYTPRPFEVWFADSVIVAVTSAEGAADPVRVYCRLSR
jgi:hypothetical protein